jgi:peptidoglycan/xylan/chitin deacetylase (PgdA/CDA1 family)
MTSGPGSTELIERPWELSESEYRQIIGKVRAGRRLAPEHWPDDCDFAVALSFDCDHETFELGVGRAAVGRLSWGEYGRRVGVPRILDALERQAVPASFFMPAVCAKLDPGESRRIIDAGHEIGMHGWIHENNSLLDEATERELMLRARDTLESVTGVAPCGFRSANWDLSANTIKLVAEMGLEYDSSLMADDDCYELEVDGASTGVVEIPVEWLRDDAVYLLFNRQPATRPWLTPQEVYEIFRLELEGAAREGGLFQLVMHPFVIGYRSRLWIMERLIEDARALGKPYFASHIDIARWVRGNA